MKDRIKKLRKELDLTQQEFADRIGIKRNSYANYETGRNTPIDAIILSICREFNVNEEWLRDGTGEMFVEMDVEDQLMDWVGSVLGGHDSKFKKDYLTMLSQLDESEWGTLEKMESMLHKYHQEKK